MKRRPRYRVGECSGLRINLPVQSGTSNNHNGGITVVITDTLRAHRIVSEWRSEDYRSKGGGSKGGQHTRQDKIDAIRAAAKATCAELNAEHDAWLEEIAA